MSLILKSAKCMRHLMWLHRASSSIALPILSNSNKYQLINTFNTTRCIQSEANEHQLNQRNIYQLNDYAERPRYFNKHDAALMRENNNFSDKPASDTIPCFPVSYIDGWLESVNSKEYSIKDCIQIMYIIINPLANSLTRSEKAERLEKTWQKLKVFKENNLKAADYEFYLQSLVKTSYNLDKQKIDNIIDEINKKGFEISAELNEAIFCANCATGSIANVQKLLGEIKTKNLTLNDKMFNSLIRCYLSNNKENEANQVYNLMKLRSIAHNSQTFFHFFDYYLVNKKDFESFSSMFSKMESEKVKLQIDHASSIADNLIQNKIDIDTIKKFLLKTNFSPLETELFSYHQYKKMFMSYPISDSLDFMKFIVDNLKDSEKDAEKIRLLNILTRKKFDDRELSLLLDSFKSLDAGNQLVEKCMTNIIYRIYERNQPVTDAIEVIKKFLMSDFNFEIRRNRLSPIYLSMMQNTDVKTLVSFNELVKMFGIKMMRPLYYDDIHLKDYFSKASVDDLYKFCNFLYDRKNRIDLNIKINVLKTIHYKITSDAMENLLIKDTKAYQTLQKLIDSDKLDWNLFSNNITFTDNITYEILRAIKYSLELKLSSGGNIIIDENLDALGKLQAHIYATLTDDLCINKLHSYLRSFYSEFIKETKEQQGAIDLLNSFMVKHELKMGSSDEVKAIVSDESVAKQLVFSDQSEEIKRNLIRLRDLYTKTHWDMNELKKLSKKLYQWKISQKYIQLKILILELDQILAQRDSPNAEENIDVLLSKLTNIEFKMDVVTMIKVIKYFLYVKSNVNEAHKMLRQLIDDQENKEKTFLLTYFHEDFKKNTAVSEMLFEVLGMHVQKAYQASDSNFQKIGEPLLDDKLLETINKFVQVYKFDNNFFHDNAKVAFNKLLKTLSGFKTLSAQRILESLLHEKFFDNMTTSWIDNPFETYLKCLLENGRCEDALEFYFSTKRRLNESNLLKTETYFTHLPILDNFVANGRLDLVQKLTDFMINTSMNIKYFMNDLYASLIANNFTEMARNLLENPNNFKFNEQQIFRNFYYFYHNRKFDSMRNMLEHLKMNHMDNMGKNINNFCFFMIRALRNDPNKLQEIYDNFDLDDFNKHYAKYLIEGEKKEDIEVKINQQEIQLFDKYFNNNNNEKTKASSEVKGDRKKETTFDTIMQKLEQATDKDSLKNVRELIREEALKGNNKLIEELSQHPKMQIFNFLRFELALAYVSTEKIEQLLQLISKDSRIFNYFIEDLKNPEATEVLTQKIWTKLNSTSENTLKLYEIIKDNRSHKYCSILFKLLSKSLFEHKLKEQFKDIFCKYQLFKDHEFIKNLQSIDFEKSEFERSYFLLDTIGQADRLSKIIIFNNMIWKYLQTNHSKEILMDMIKTVENKYNIKYNDIHIKTRNMAALVLDSK